MNWLPKIREKLTRGTDDCFGILDVGSQQLKIATGQVGRGVLGFQEAGTNGLV